MSNTRSIRSSRIEDNATRGVASYRCLTIVDLLLLFGLVASLHAAPLLAAEPDWTDRIRQRVAQHPGEAAVVVKHLQSGATLAVREVDVFPTASLIKLPVMVEAYRQAEAGTVRLTDSVTLQDADKVPGSGILTTHFSAGATFSLRDAIRLMMAWSDNTATNLVIDRIGLAATNRTMQDWGFEETRLNAKVFRRDTSLDLERSKRYGLGSTTAGEMVRLLERLARRELASASACDAMLDHLAACQDKAMFPKHLPPEAKVRHKTGGVTGVRTDAGIIEGPGGTIVLCVLTNRNRTPAGETADPGESLCADVARLAFEHFNPPELLQKAREAAGKLRQGDSGPRVTELQRKLNERLRPSPDLAVDGEFGPMTHAAVVRWQRDRKLDPSGVVDAATWQSLQNP